MSKNLDILSFLNKIPVQAWEKWAKQNGLVFIQKYDDENKTKEFHAQNALTYISDADYVLIGRSTDLITAELDDLNFGGHFISFRYKNDYKNSHHWHFLLNKALFLINEDLAYSVDFYGMAVAIDEIINEVYACR